LNPERSFPGTDWSAVRSAVHRPDALDELLRQYFPPLRGYLAARFRLPGAELDDLLQGFVLDKILTSEILDRADRSRGRFRIFLINALTRYVISEIRRAHARKRAPDFQTLPFSALSEHDLSKLAAEVPRGLDRAFAKAVFAQAVDRMKEECAAKGRADLWQAFQQHLLAPLEKGSARVPPEGSARQLTNLLTTAKRMFARNFRAVVSEYVPVQEDLDEEVRELKLLLSY
jgi:hypothetical protein